MLRAEMHNSQDFVIIRLEGRFAGEGADQVRTLATRSHIEGKFVVDLTDVTFVDAAAEEVLSFLKRLGAEFVADNSYTLDFCERLNLPVIPKTKWNPDGSGKSGGQGQDTPDRHMLKDFPPGR